jgi:hypothetical protein
MSAQLNNCLFSRLVETHEKVADILGACFNLTFVISQFILYAFFCRKSIKSDFLSDPPPFVLFRKSLSCGGLLHLC